jgi:4-amino-4-deoxy-L-arabinose transferase-like glycosyltransferase
LDSKQSSSEEGGTGLEAPEPGGSTARVAWTAAAIFSCSLGVRLLYLAQAQVDPRYSQLGGILDCLYYHKQAAAIASSQGFGELPFFLSPLYVALLGGVYTLFGAEHVHALRLHAVLGALSCCLVYAIARRAFGEREGIAAGLLLGLYGAQIYYTGLLLPTTLVLFLNLLALLAMMPPAGRPPSGLRFAVSGLLIGLAIAVKSNALLLLPVALLAIFLVPKAKRRSWVIWAGCVIAGAAVTLAPFTLHNVATSGRFVLVNTTGGRNLWKGNGPSATGTHIQLPLAEEGTSLSAYLDSAQRATIDPEQPVVESREFTRRTIRYIAKHPRRALRLFAKKTVLFFNAVELGVRDDHEFARRYSSLLASPLPAFSIVAPLGLAGMLIAWRRRRRLAVLYALFATQVASFVLVFVLARYRMVAVACLIVFAAHWLVVAADALRRRELRLLAPSLLLGAVAALIVNWPLAGFARDRSFASQHALVGYALMAGDHLYTEGDAYEQLTRQRLWLGQVDRQLMMNQVDAAKRSLRERLAELDALGGESYEPLRREVRERLRQLQERAPTSPSAPPSEDR